MMMMDDEMSDSDDQCFGHFERVIMHPKEKSFLLSDTEEEEEEEEEEVLLHKVCEDPGFWPKPEADIFDHTTRLILHRVAEKLFGLENLLAMCVLGGLGGFEALMKSKVEEVLWNEIKRESGGNYELLLSIFPRHTMVHYLLDQVPEEKKPRLKRFYRFTNWKLKPLEYENDFFLETGMYFRDFQKQFKVSHQRFEMLEKSIQKYAAFAEKKDVTGKFISRKLKMLCALKLLQQGYQPKV